MKSADRSGPRSAGAKSIRISGVTDALPSQITVIYPIQARTRKSLGEMTRKLSVTSSQ